MDPLLDNAPCGYLRFADDGTVESVNTTLSEMLSRSKESMVGKHIEGLFPPGGRIFYQTHVFPLLRLHGKAEEIYMALQASDGTDVPVLVNAARRERDGVIGNECVIVRMRQRIRFEEELLRAKKAAELASEAKAKFLSVMSHELRTPLQAITNYADLLTLGPPLTEDQQRCLSSIDHASRSLRVLIDDILNFARMESGEVFIALKPVDMDAALKRAESLLLFRIEEAGIDYDRGTCTAIHVARADPDRLQQIILNLLTNATKFTDRGGRIRVACESDARRVSLSVRDSGCGIPQDKLEAVFEPFIQLHRDSHPSGQLGAGLGLAISRQLARAMGGELTATSAIGEGSEFVLTLPAAPASPERHTNDGDDAVRASNPSSARDAHPRAGLSGTSRRPRAPAEALPRAMPRP